MGLVLLFVELTGFWLCESFDSLLPISRWITECCELQTVLMADGTDIVNAGPSYITLVN